MPVGGVSVDAVTRIHDTFLEATRSAAGARQQALTTQNSTLTSVQTRLSEPGDTGLQAGLDAFYSAWHELSLNPSDGAAGSVVIQKGLAVTDQLHSVSGGIGQEWNTARATLADTVAQANQAASDLANLNGKIIEGTASGHPVNELLDKRDSLARKLGDLVGGTTAHLADGSISVSVNGITIVSGTGAEKLTLAGGTDVTTAASNPPVVTWSGTPVPIDSGAAAGALVTLRTDLPTLSAKLDGVAVALRDAVNSVHTTGFTLAGAPGADFFSGTDARTISVVPTQPGELAMASVSGTVDGSVALKIGDLSDDVASSAALGGGAGASSRWKDMTTTLGVQLQSLGNAVTVQDSVVATSDAAVAADSGVNIDEEMTNMLLYQRAYQASARVITTIDSMLDTLINRTGTG
jgi:flagellar hook-associated protein 1 FlgK